jgi:hypothetical protein
MADAGQLSVGSVAQRLALSVAAGGNAMEAPVTGAQVSDLLSYVMAQGRQGDIWITIQVHPNIVAVAELVGLAAIIIAGGFEPEDDTVARAEEEGIALLRSTKSAFVLAGELYQMGVR